LYWARYLGLLDGQMASQVYAVFYQLLETVSVEEIYGIVLDFRDVKRFDRTNLTATRQESRTLNKTYDLSRIPVAMLVKNLMQEQFVKISSKITGTEHRVRIVWTEEEMRAFFSNFHASLAAQPKEQD
ncbi:MAG: hypothetical protein CUN55_02195, partial [Phototrophicales bacterium]